MTTKTAIKQLASLPDAAEVSLVERIRGDRIAALGVWLTLGIVAVQTFLHLVNLVLDTDVRMLDVNGEQNFPTWLNTVAIFAAALACLLLAAIAREGATAPLVLASLLAFLSLDEAVTIHERATTRFLDLVGVGGVWDSVVWPLLYLPLLATVAALLWRESRRSSGPTFLLVMVGFACLAAAVGAEVLSAPFSDGSNTDGLVNALEGALEEALELAGWGLIATGLFSRFASEARAEAQASPPATDGGRQSIVK